MPAWAGGVEFDQFDALCEHVLVESLQGDLVCCFRVLPFASGVELHKSYAAQYYDLERLSSYAKPMIELGRFCIHPDATNADVLRIAWAMLAAIVDVQGAGLLFGCSSFEGTDPAPYGAALDLLAARYIAPDRWRPNVGSARIIPFGKRARPDFDSRLALGQLPSFLKTYLSMGGWVSDHAVIDPDLNTFHVFTAVEIAAIPPARAKALRAI